MEYTPRITDNALCARTAAAGSMVLLKNVRGTLPLCCDDQPLCVAVFGTGQIFTACCSSTIQPWHTVNILDALCASQMLRPDALLAHQYRAWCLEHPDGAQLPPDRLCIDEFAESNDAALIVITRSADVYDPQLTAEEREMICAVCDRFSRTALVLNTPGYMQLGELAQQVGAILFMGIAGQEAGHALADILTAKAVPSGRLAHSWPAEFTAFDDATAHMDIFSGYRWFDAFGAEILYPFGYGLNYGKSELTAVSVGLDGCEVVVTATVENTGLTHPLREVVQVYYSNPASGKNGVMQSLNCFGKTRLLEPGEQQTLTLRFPVEQMAVFREEACAYVLEEGYYDIRVGTASRSTYIAGSLRLTRNAVVKAVFPMQMADVKDRLRTGDACFTYPEQAEELASARRRAIRLSDRILPRKSHKKGRTFTGCRSDGKRHTLQDVLRGWCSAFQLIASMDDASLRKLVCDFGSEPSDIPGALGASAALEDYGIPSLHIAAGSDGLQLKKELRDDDDKVISRRLCTAFPAASLLACSFDMELIRSVGAAIGREMDEFGIDLWLAPGVNLQRSPRQTGFDQCWSEDPVLCGHCAAALAVGVSRFGAPVLRSVAAENSAVSQHAFRQLYALGFEIACGAYPAALIPTTSVNGELPGEDSAIARSMILDWRFGGMFLADNVRYDGEPTRVALEKSALRIIKLLQSSKKA